MGHRGVRRLTALAGALVLSACHASSSATRDMGSDAVEPDAMSAAHAPAIDGVLDEWGAEPTLAVDPAGDAKGAFDVVALRAVARGTIVYLKLDLADKLGAHLGPSSDGSLALEFTLPAGEVLILDLRKNTVQADGSALRWSDIGYRIAPTHESASFELRLDLKRFKVVQGDTVTLQLSGSDALAAPATIRLDTPAISEQRRSPDRPSGADLRVASLNTDDNGLSPNTSRFDKLRRIVLGVKADIFCAQEMFGTFINWGVLGPSGDKSWKGVKHGNVVIGARGTVKALPTEHSGQDFIGASVKLQSRTVVVLCLRLTPGGWAGQPADKERIDDANRVAATLQKVRSGTHGSELTQAPVIVLGDFGLVGSRTPLDVLEDASAGPGLTRWTLRHLLGRDAHTYRARTSSVTDPPGIHDLLLYSAGTLEPKHGFVLDTSELEPAALTGLGAKAGDSRGSDHLMLVGDFAYK